ncbi:hypothetical protein CTAYLR_002594 [Chrysophaeum taylorii]|uniref:Glucose-methanol-choline oxidoreductase N-terminal domain-containing protein n=1 Tax=Chrysophaeum taylorii TaxID=2483200 RepID=A0AAD7UDV0_9STRA|nr:hypothetical protein CTAYLR_002594 [Chrysophaeum taylorii]
MAGKRVVLVEAGPDDREFSDVRTPVKWLEMHPEITYKHYTEKVWETPRRSGLAEVELGGKVLGGSSSINGMVYLRGAKSVYDKWGWGDLNWEALEDALGPLGTATPTRAAEAFLDAARENFGFEDAKNDDCEFLPDSKGDAFCKRTAQTISPRGHRISSATAFLTDEVRRLPNLRILTKTRALRIEFENDGSVATGVLVEREGKEEIIEARNEVILCAGALLTPQLLLLSGIGPASELESIGIRPRVDLPGVGKNLTSHAVADVLIPLKRRDDGLTEVTNTTTFLDAYAYMYSSFCKAVRCAAPDVALTAAYFPKFRAANGEETARIQALPQGHVAVAASRYGSPKARGTVSLRSADPRDSPKIDPNYLGSAEDVAIILEGMRRIQDIARSAANVFGEPMAFPRPNSTLRETFERTAMTYFHPVGTARMGDDETAVVDFDLRVRGGGGVRNLRVADASVIPLIPNANTNPAAMMIGLKAADLILQDDDDAERKKNACVHNPN